MKISLVADGVSPIKIYYSDYTKSSIDRLNTFFTSPKHTVIASSLQQTLSWNVVLFVLLRSNSLLCWYGFCDVIITLSK